MEFFEARNIYKSYADHLALNDVSIAIPEGNIFGLLGPNGAGKTTLIRIINQINAPDKGEILFDGKILNPSHTSEIGYLPEERGLYKKMKVGEQAIYLAQLKGLSRRDALKRLKHWFEKFEIQGWWDKKVEELSKGMQQKVQFIVTVIHKPKLLIFDEPFSGFDPINANLLKEEILSLKAEGSTIIFSTHNMASVEELCDYITLLNNSETILNGYIKDVYEEYRSNQYEIKFFGNFNRLGSTLTHEYQIVKEESDKDEHKMIVKLNEGVSTNKMISNMLEFGTIVGVKEILPTMNDIFIQRVQETNKNSETDQLAS